MACFSCEPASVLTLCIPSRRLLLLLLLLLHTTRAGAPPQDGFTLRETPTARTFQDHSSDKTGEAMAREILQHIKLKRSLVMSTKLIPKVDAAAAEEKKVQERRRAADNAIAMLNLQQNFPKQSGTTPQWEGRRLQHLQCEQATCYHSLLPNG